MKNGNVRNTPHLDRTYTVPIPYLYRTYAVPTPYLPRTYPVPSPYLSKNILPYLCRTYTVPILIPAQLVYGRINAVDACTYAVYLFTPVGVLTPLGHMQAQDQTPTTIPTTFAIHHEPVTNPIKMKAGQEPEEKATPRGTRNGA